MEPASAAAPETPRLRDRIKSLFSNFLADERWDIIGRNAVLRIPSSSRVFTISLITRPDSLTAGITLTVESLQLMQARSIEVRFDDVLDGPWPAGVTPGIYLDSGLEWHGEPKGWEHLRDQISTWLRSAEPSYDG